MFIYCFGEPNPRFLVSECATDCTESCRQKYLTFIQMSEPGQQFSELQNKPKQARDSKWSLRKYSQTKLPIIFQFKKLLRVFSRGELVVYDFCVCATLLPISSSLNVISLPSQKPELSFSNLSRWYADSIFPYRDFTIYVSAPVSHFQKWDL